VTAAAFLTIAAILLFFAAVHLGGRTGIPAGAEVMSSDVDGESTDTLEDPGLRLRGRPDYLLRERGRQRFYPVEVKPARESTTLYEGDVLQLAAYMLLVEARYGRAFAGYGIVRYRSSEFRVPLTADLRRRCLAAVDGIRVARGTSDVHRSHSIAARCRRCAVRAHCAEALDRGQ
jgi:CRISPR/Cas system-associated exonuclease Cas4 (RecB family)